jgi:PTH1 family peptidyl-tRNA hydrolase
MKIIVGLGNPGKKYEGTRHNAGFMVIDRFAEKLEIKIEKKKFSALIGETTVKGEKCLLVKPQTYMNLSGEAVLAVKQFYKAQPEDIIVVYDDMDLPVGKIRIRKQGGSGGHKGMISIISCLGTENFIRIRIGIGGPKDRSEQEVINHVLGDFTSEEKAIIRETQEKAAEAVLLLLQEGVEASMNRYNK